MTSTLKSMTSRNRVWNWKRELKKEAHLFVVGLVLVALAGLVAYFGLMAAVHRLTR
jgi:tetrahydromethanopterin S-methyltransferase subunit B